MQILSEKAVIALHAAVYMAGERGRMHTLGEIASHFGISGNHLSKVLQALVRGGILESTKGKGGGFRMKEGAEEKTLMDVYEAVEGEWSERKCLFSADKSENCTCFLGRLLDGLNTTFTTYMEGNTLKALAQEGAGAGGDLK